MPPVSKANLQKAVENVACVSPSLKSCFGPDNNGLMHCYKAADLWRRTDGPANK
jgi:hypothetical protein